MNVVDRMARLAMIAHNGVSGLCLYQVNLESKEL